jgi:hypothetical protein
VEMIMMAGVCNDLLPVVMRKEEVFMFTEEEIDNYLAATNPELLATSY